MRALIVAALLVAASPAFAAPPQNEIAQKAREAFTDGTTAFNLGQWDRAIEAWTRGYSIKPDPIFLYNIAQAHRLAENFEKAVFFYRNYLRSSPKAPNRLEVEERIDQLEKIIEAKKSAREAPPQEPRVLGQQPKASPQPETTTPETPPPTPTTPPPTTTTEPTTTVTRALPPSRPLRRGDLAISGGVNVWALGVPNGADPSTNVALSGGYTVWYNDRLELRIGAKVGYTYLVDIHSTMHFLSVDADPMLAFRLWRDHLFGYVEIGVGAMILSGLKGGSDLLVARAVPSGTFAAFELRPALGLEYRINSRLGIFLSPAIIYSPSPHKLFVDSTILRFDLSLGASVRL